MLTSAGVGIFYAEVKFTTSSGICMSLHKDGHCLIPNIDGWLYNILRYNLSRDSLSNLVEWLETA